MSTMITKMDGTKEPFKPNKLRNSLRQAGASKKEIQSVVERIEAELYPEMSTEKIYKNAFNYLKHDENIAAARYSLRRALFALGPTGFPFEDFLARLFKEEGYQVKVGTKIKGNCVQHEIDLAAYRDTDSFVAEAKFHSKPSIKTDLQVLMYSYARKVDLMERKICAEDHCGISDLTVITNTKFTTMAKKYAECMGMELLSWEYPKENNLHDRIKATGLYPVTVLQTLSNSKKKFLIESGVIVCGDINKNTKILKGLNLSKKKTEAVLSEVRQLCKV